MVAPVLANAETKERSSRGQPSLNAFAVEPPAMKVGHGMSHAKAVYVPGVAISADNVGKFVQVAGVIIDSVVRELALST